MERMSPILNWDDDPKPRSLRRSDRSSICPHATIFGVAIGTAAVGSRPASSVSPSSRSSFDETLGPRKIRQSQSGASCGEETAATRSVTSVSHHTDDFNASISSLTDLSHVQDDVPLVVKSKNSWKPSTFSRGRHANSDGAGALRVRFEMNKPKNIVMANRGIAQAEIPTLSQGSWTTAKAEIHSVHISGATPVPTSNPQSACTKKSAFMSTFDEQVRHLVQKRRAVTDKKVKLTAGTTSLKDRLKTFQ